MNKIISNRFLIVPFVVESRPDLASPFGDSSAIPVGALRGLSRGDISEMKLNGRELVSGGGNRALENFLKVTTISGGVISGIGSLLISWANLVYPISEPLDEWIFGDQCRQLYFRLGNLINENEGRGGSTMESLIECFEDHTLSWYIDTERVLRGLNALLLGGYLFTGISWGAQNLIKGKDDSRDQKSSSPKMKTTWLPLCAGGTVSVYHLVNLVLGGILLSMASGVQEDFCPDEVSEITQQIAASNIPKAMEGWEELGECMEGIKESLFDFSYVLAGFNGLFYLPIYLVYLLLCCLGE